MTNMKNKGKNIPLILQTVKHTESYNSGKRS